MATLSTWCKSRLTMLLAAHVDLLVIDHNQYSTWNRTRRIRAAPFLARTDTNTSRAATTMATRPAGGNSGGAANRDNKKQEALFGPNIGVVNSGPAWTDVKEKKVLAEELTPEIVQSWIARSKEVRSLYSCTDSHTNQSMSGSLPNPQLLYKLLSTSSVLHFVSRRWRWHQMTIHHMPTLIITMALSLNTTAMPPNVAYMFTFSCPPIILMPIRRSASSAFLYSKQSWKVASAKSSNSRKVPLWN